MYDAILVGGGLAGCVLGHKFLSRNKSIFLVDKGDLSNCSKIAAGIYNPIAGKYFALSWNAEEVWMNLAPFYVEIEKKLNQRFLFPMPIRRIISTNDQFEKWGKRKSQERYLPFISIQKDSLPEYIKASSYGYINIEQTGYLSVKKFINHSIHHFNSLGFFANEQFNFNQLVIEKDKIEYKGITAKRLICCTGYLEAKNGLFSYLPFTPMKGEILLAANQFGLKNIFTKSCFILPTEDEKIKIGSTYNWKEINENITRTSKDILKSKLENLLVQKIEFTDQVAGVRPSVKDRKPLLGAHPKYKNIFLFNGFGSKGVSLAPFLSELLFKNIFEGKTIPQELNLQRFSFG